jgi:hypothetical protein
MSRTVIGDNGITPLELAKQIQQENQILSVAWSKMPFSFPLKQWVRTSPFSIKAKISSK